MTLALILLMAVLMPVVVLVIGFSLAAVVIRGQGGTPLSPTEAAAEFAIQMREMFGPND